jgi:hypothetical protein
MKFQTNDLLKSALGRVNQTLKAFPTLKTWDVSKIRNDFSPTQNFEALKRFMQSGHYQMVNDVNTGTRGTGLINRYGDAAIAQYLLVQKGASLDTNVAVFTSGQPFGVTLFGGVSATEISPVRLLSAGVGTVSYTSDSSAAIAVGAILVGVSGGTVKTRTVTTTETLVVGIAIEACANGATGTDKEFEAMPCYNYKTV